MKRAMICRELCLILILFLLQKLSGASSTSSSNNNSKLSGEKIVNGQIVSSRMSFPYHIAMLLKKMDSKDFILCGGKWKFLLNISLTMFHTRKI